jgi:hypothetical protein
MNCWTTYDEQPPLQKPNRTLLGSTGRMDKGSNTGGLPEITQVK